MNHNLEKNKQNAIAFYRTACMGDPQKAVELYVSAKYIQHNPLVGDGDLVALHIHQNWPNDEEYVTMDFFRFDENGKIVEHWDSIQEIPSETKNGNPMY